MLDKTTTDFAGGLDRYFNTLAGLLKDAEVTDAGKRKIALSEGCEWFRRRGACGTRCRQQDHVCG